MLDLLLYLIILNISSSDLDHLRNSHLNNSQQVRRLFMEENNQETREDKVTKAVQSNCAEDRYCRTPAYGPQCCTGQVIL